MSRLLIQIKEFFLNLFFPSGCINCQKEGSYLCQDCLSLIDIPQNQYCPFCYPPKIVLDGRICYLCRKKGKKLAGLFFAAPYQNFIIKKLIRQFKYEPYLKGLAKTLSSLIIEHLQLFGKKPDFFQAILVPIPLTKKRLKWRGFNQAEELAKELSLFLPGRLAKLKEAGRNIPLANDILLKIKETLPQVELSGKEREENIKGAFICKNPDKARGKKILLVDDVFTTGSTMEECARVLKMAGAKEVWGIVVARE